MDAVLQQELGQHHVPAVGTCAVKYDGSNNRALTFIYVSGTNTRGPLLPGPVRIKAYRLEGMLQLAAITYELLV